MSEMEIHPLILDRIHDTQKAKKNQLSEQIEILIRENRNIIISLATLQQRPGFECLSALIKIHENIIAVFEILIPYDDLCHEAIAALAENSLRTCQNTTHIFQLLARIRAAQETAGVMAESGV